MNAAESGDTEVVRELIQAGADVNIQDDMGWTALMYVMEYGHTEVVKELIQAGMSGKPVNHNFQYKNIRKRNRLGGWLL